MEPLPPPPLPTGTDVPVVNLNLLLGLTRGPSPASASAPDDASVESSTHSSISLPAPPSPRSATTDESFVDGVHVGREHARVAYTGPVTLRAKANRRDKEEDRGRRKGGPPRHLNTKGLTQHSGHRRRRRWLNGTPTRARARGGWESV